MAAGHPKPIGRRVGRPPNPLPGGEPNAKFLSGLNMQQNQWLEFSEQGFFALQKTLQWPMPRAMKMRLPAPSLLPAQKFAAGRTRGANLPYRVTAQSLPTAQLPVENVWLARGQPAEKNFSCYRSESPAKPCRFRNRNRR